MTRKLYTIFGVIFGILIVLVGLLNKKNFDSFSFSIIFKVFLVFPQTYPGPGTPMDPGTFEGILSITNKS